MSLIGWVATCGDPSNIEYGLTALNNNSIIGVGDNIDTHVLEMDLEDDHPASPAPTNLSHQKDYTTEEEILLVSIYRHKLKKYVKY